MSFERSWVEIDLDNFSHNLQQLKNKLKPDTAFMQIVKADGYGHGAYEIALQSIKEGAVYLGVANAEEGALLRYQNIKTPILILSPSFEEEIDFILENDLTPTVSSLEFARTLNEKTKNQKKKIHLEIDTGMGRSGFRYDEAKDIINMIKSLSNLEIEGVFSHFSCSESDPDYNLLQSERFRELISRLDFTPQYIHIANSSGILTSNPDYANLVRIGLLSYGVYSSELFKKEIELKPVMSFKSTICQTKLAKKGEPIGYNRTYLAEKNIKYAIIPVGYADGYDYLLSNRGEVLIHNKPFPVIGKISMDMLTVDITDDESIKNGDEVTLLNSGCLSSENIVSKYHGLSYELLCQIGRRAKRYFRSNGKIIATSPLARREFVSHDFNDSKLNLIIESAISQRLQSKEIASMLYSEILRRFFVDKDRDVHYRKNFRYQIEFSIPKNELAESFYEVKTTLNFSKVLQQEYFFIACANRLEDLQSYFRRRDVEYRWLLDSNFRLSQDFFDVNQVHINNILLDHTSEIKNGCLEIKCTHTNLAALMNREVNFSISTKTYYPNKSHQLATYITEMTQGVEISFIFPEEHFSQVEVASIFSGQNKYPTIVRDSNRIRVSSDEKEWIFPNSGVVFSY